MFFICNQNCVDLLLWEAFVFTKSLNSFLDFQSDLNYYSALDGALMKLQRRV